MGGGCVQSDLDGVVEGCKVSGRVVGFGFRAESLQALGF